MDEARLEHTQYGLTPATEGWFAVNLRDAGWMTNEAMGAACIFEGDKISFGQIGYTLQVLEPGQPSGMYHREGDQEDFLVLSGECLAIVEGQERPLRAFDFLHCPPGTEHIFVGAGVDVETSHSREAYAPFPPWRPGKTKGAWPL